MPSNNGRKIMGRADFESARLNTEEIEVPNFGWVKLRELTALERGDYQRDLMRRRDNEGEKQIEVNEWKISVAARHIIGEDGKLLFSQDEGDLAVLGSIAGSGIDTIFDAAMRLSGMVKDEDGKDEKEVPLAPENDLKTA